jgi:hypothetical protein
MDPIIWLCLPFGVLCAYLALRWADKEIKL